VDPAEVPFSWSDAPRQGIGGFFRHIVAFIESRGAKDAVLAAVPPETRALFADPPRVTAWVPSKHIDELEAAFLKVAGREATVEMGRVCSRSLGATIVQPVLRLAFMLLGQGPATIFENLDRFFSLATRGIEFTWEPQAKKAGMVTARFVGPDTPEAAFHVLQGSLEFIFDLCGVSGEVGTAEVEEESDAGATVRYRVSWH
jgi:hypothetical protein